jgi:aspartyl protease family protein
MGNEEFEDRGTGEARWGSGLLWPVLKITSVIVLGAVVVHWALDAGGTQPGSTAQAVSPPAAPAREAADAPDNGRRELAVRADRSGHFVIDAVVDGENLRFLMDTGASTLVLSRDDAQRLGIDSSRLEFSESYQTANGVALGAPVVLREFRIGSFSLHDVRATVMAQPMPISLLGMNVLSRFAGHEVEGNRLVLRW